MSSTVRIDEDDKDRLRRLQDAWSRVKGERVSQKELIGRILAYLEERQDEFLDEAGWEPLTDEEIDRIEARSRDMGNWSSRDIDEAIYS